MNSTALRRSTRRSAGIQDGAALSKLGILPYELLVEILQLLAWKDVLRARLTCKRLAEATRTRAIWLHLIDLHTMDNPQRARLERPVDIYTSRELERRLLFWKSAEIAWELKRGRPSRTRTFGAAKAEFLHLIKGGRWLLVTDETCAVSYYDLESESITGVSLISPPKTTTYIDISMTIDVDNHSPFLTFNIAFSLFDGSHMDPKHPFPRLTVEIWGVCLALNASQRAVGLTATRLAYFPHRPMVVSVGSISLLGEYLAVRANIADSSYAIVINWKQANKNPLTYLWRVAQSTGYQATLQLLPDNKLLTVTSQLKLSDYSMIPESSCVPDIAQDFPTLWHQQYRGRRVLYMSNPFFSENHTTCLWNTFDSLWKVDIPRATSFDGVLPVVTLADYPSASQHLKPFIGYSHAVVPDPTGGKQMTVITYNHPDESKPGPAFLSRTLHLAHVPGLMPSVLADEASGRIVYCSQGQPSALFVIDLAWCLSPDRFLYV